MFVYEINICILVRVGGNILVRLIKWYFRELEKVAKSLSWKKDLILRRRLVGNSVLSITLLSEQTNNQN